MNILMLTENDPAGMGIAFTHAINRHTEHCCRLITTKVKYNFDFEKDLHVPDLDKDGFEEIALLLHKADIIHFHVLADENMDLGPIKLRNFIHGKTLIHHHHGHPDFRANPEKYREKYRRLRRKALVSTPDLLRLLPEATWQPNLVPINDPLLLPASMPANGSIIIGQSVTRKDLKNTQELLEAVAGIKLEGSKPNLKVDIIENTEHRECLIRKQRCHVIFDHMQGYFGVSSLESLSQGKPVIAGLDEWNLSHIREFAGTSDVPWLICRTREELKTKIECLALEPELPTSLGEKSRRFMCHHWSDKRAAEALILFYASC